MKDRPESAESLWLLVISPSVWAAHFMACYLTAAIWCAKIGETNQFAQVRWLFGIYTLLAMVVIAVTGTYGYRRYRTRRSTTGPLHHDTAEDRYGFIGLAMLLLSGLSAVATLLVGLVAMFIRSC